MKRKILFLLAILLTVSPVFCQTLEEFKKAQQEGLKRQKQQQQNGLNEAAIALELYKKRERESFANYLIEDWMKRKAFHADSMPQEVKPKEVPTTTPKRIKRKTKKIKHIDRIYIPKTVVLSTTKVEKEKEEFLIPWAKADDGNYEANVTGVGFSFYGSYIFFKTFNRWTEVAFDGKSKEEAIANVYKKWSRMDVSDDIASLKELRDSYQLNDYGYYMLIKDISTYLFKDSESLQTLWTWYVLLEQSYDVRLAYHDDEIAMMYATDVQVYRKLSMMIGKNQYYMTSNYSGSWYIYEDQFKGANTPLKMTFSNAMLLSESNKNIPVAFAYKKKDYKFDFTYNKNLIDFYKNYPPIAVQEHFSTPVTEEMIQSIDKQLKPVVSALETPKEKVDFLLSFVQHAFPYKRDVEQFGKEKYFYVEEMFAYPFSDCEDRSVLFSFLVDHFVSLPTVGVWSPGHMFVAVDLSPAQGDVVYYKKTAFTVCDPTYVGASIGQGMPNVMKEKVSLIPCR
ncbi:hypothetical protein K4L44_10265 [Halosquirtibacter laminarini]|uniref:Uncharacterized protein n=1 Tax=Halosquirtibacter laminarini TaxID=3374600 RepID=A0AC61NNA6_9BACT|nr:hypothetical protein K4L44_10265 [Prolixibacteraceae bacterium]